MIDDDHEDVDDDCIIIQKGFNQMLEHVQSIHLIRRIDLENF
jgi:hypothetical protein